MDFVWSLGTVNWGTSVRHSLSSFIIIFFIYSIARAQKIQNKKSIIHIQNLLNNINGAKEWRKNVNYTIHNNDLQHLLNYIESKQLG